MSNVFVVPEDVGQTPIPVVDLPPGPYWAEIVKASARSFTKVAVLYQITEEGPGEGAQIWENFNLEYKKGKELFGDFLEALGIGRSATVVDLDELKGKTLCITVEKNGQWTNVTEHRSEPF